MIPVPFTDEEARLRVRWKHGVVPVIGLIGGIGSGKSTAARMLADRGAVVIDADAVGHELLEDPAIRGRVVERFGAGVLEARPTVEAPGPRISRRALAAVVFAEAPALRDLEAILHPAMRDRFLRTIDRVAREGHAPCVVLDAAVLLEAGWDDLCDRVVFVDAPRSERLRRVREARGWSEAALEARERSQWPCDRKRRGADGILDNDGDPARLGREVDRILARLHETAAPPASRTAGRVHGDPAPAGLVPGSPVTPGRAS